MTHEPFCNCRRADAPPVTDDAYYCRCRALLTLAADPAEWRDLFFGERDMEDYDA